jgi:hypothetical protein
MLEEVLGFDLIHIGYMQAAKYIEGNNPHLRPTTESTELTEKQVNKKLSACRDYMQ